jgi:hypothetical protein
VSLQQVRVLNICGDATPRTLTTGIYLSKKRNQRIIQRVREKMPGLHNGYELQQNERQEQQQHESFLVANGVSQLSSAKIKSIIKDFKTHRYALDFDSAFIKYVITK